MTKEQFIKHFGTFFFSGLAGGLFIAEQYIGALFVLGSAVLSELVLINMHLEERNAHDRSQADRT